MRQDRQLPFENEDFNRGAAGERLDRPYLRGSQAFSGSERNHLFMNKGGTEFRDLSGISGMDSLADGRVLSLLDYDRDGRTDLAVVNASSPLLQLFRNQVAKVGNVVAVRLTGGAMAKDFSGWTNRDGVGARVTVTTAGRKLVRENRYGEGFASQNSRTLLIGIGSATKADAVEVHWPSGRTQKTTDVAAGSLVTIHERLGDRGFSVTRYLRDIRAPMPVRAPKSDLRLAINEPQPRPRLTLYTAMTTTCPGCKRDLPQIARLRQALSQDVRLVGVPIDAKEGADKLSVYRQRYSPAYDLLTEVRAPQRGVMTTLLNKLLGTTATPATLVTNTQGFVVHAQQGVPTVSVMRKLLQN